MKASIGHNVTIDLYEKLNGADIAKLSCFWSLICCVFRPAFGCCAHPQAGRNIFTGMIILYQLKNLKNKILKIKQNKH